MRCLSKIEFDKIYPEHEKIAEGAYGRIYSVRNKDVIIKVQPWRSEGFIRDITMMSQFSGHPNIINALDIAFDGHNGYIAQPRGMSIVDIAKQKSLSPEEILTDIVNGMAFLDANCLFHGDLKDGNVVYHDGKAKIIDFGLARRNNLYEEIGYANKGIAYTEMYRDPEYQEFEYFEPPASSKSESYSIAMTMYYLYYRLHPIYRTDDVPIYPYGPERSFYPTREQWEALGLQPPIIDWLLQSTRLQDERPTLAELHRSPALLANRLTPPRIVELPPATAEGIPNYEEVVDILESVILPFCKSLSLSLNVYLNAVNIAIRSIKANVSATTSDVLLTSVFISTCLFQDDMVDDVLDGMDDVKVDVLCKMYTALGGCFMGHTPFDGITTKSEATYSVIATLCDDYDSSILHSDEMSERIDRGKLRMSEIDIELPQPPMSIFEKPLKDYPSPLPSLNKEEELFGDAFRQAKRILSLKKEEMTKESEGFREAIHILITYRRSLSKYPHYKDTFVKLLEMQSRMCHNDVVRKRLLPYLQ
jgi:serine/threonine protein kinase